MYMHKNETIPSTYTVHENKLKIHKKDLKVNHRTIKILEENRQ